MLGNYRYVQIKFKFIRLSGLNLLTIRKFILIVIVKVSGMFAISIIQKQVCAFLYSRHAINNFRHLWKVKKAFIHCWPLFLKKNVTFCGSRRNRKDTNIPRYLLLAETIPWFHRGNLTGI